MWIAERIDRVIAIMVLVSLCFLKFEIAVADQLSAENGELTVSGELDRALQAQDDKRPDWMDREGIEQLSFAMGILMHSTVQDVNLSTAHVALGMESQRRVNRKMGGSYITAVQAQKIVKEYKNHLKASANRFMEKWREDFKVNTDDYFWEVVEVPCESGSRTSGTGIRNDYQYLLSDGWNYLYPEGLVLNDSENIAKRLESVFCMDESVPVERWRVKGFDSSDEVIDGLQHLVQSEDKTLLAKWKKKLVSWISSQPKLRAGFVYDFAIPAENAYGDKGMDGVVLPHAVLRMLIRPNIDSQ